MVVKIAVLGAGINGLACALRIKERYKDYQVVIIAREFCPDTTADGSGGLWYPYLVGNTPEHLLAKWGAETYTLLHKLWLEGGYGICFVPCFNLYADANNYRKPSWSDAVFSFRVLEKEYLKFLSELYNTKFEAGQAFSTFSTFVTTTTPFLTQLANQFKSLNGIMVQATIKSLDDSILDSFDIVVNCMGLGAKDVVPDERVHAIRGQVSRVIAPWINACVFDGAGHYILPNEHTCVLGGTHQVNDYNKNLDDKDTEFVMEGCQKIMPTLKHAKLYAQWVGLRPARDEVRLEAERREGKLFIHNYGHGGSGLTLFWGCATDVIQLLDKNYVHNVCKL